MRAAIAVLVLLAACGKSRSAKPGPPDAGACAADTDCTLSALRATGECCPMLCDGRAAYHVDDLANLEAATEARCDERDYGACPRAECGLPIEQQAVCRAGRCEREIIPTEIVQMTWTTHCTRDDDCELSNEGPTTGCCGSCEEQFAYDKDALLAMRNAFRARCPGFCMSDCGRAPWRQRAVCVEGACAVERRAW